MSRKHEPPTKCIIHGADKEGHFFIFAQRHGLYTNVSHFNITMTADEVKKIEDKFGITLPSHYVTFIMNFEGFINNDNNPEDFIYKDFIYTSSEHLIEVNEFVGFYSNEKIIKNKLIIGDNGGGDYYLIDLKNSADKKVYFLDHEESIENNFDKNTNSWNWDGLALEHYLTLQDYEKELREMFGLE